MPFSDNERELFDNLYRVKSQPIRDRYNAELKKLHSVNGTNKHSLYLKVIKEFAREDIAAIVGAYLLVEFRWV